MRRIPLALSIAALAVSQTATAGAAFPDDYDPAYGTGGTNTIAVPGLTGIAPFLDGVPDGAGGAYAVGRADVDNKARALLVKVTVAGQPDPSFSEDGVRTDLFPGQFTVGQAVARQGDSKPVIGGSDSTSAFVARYTTAGAPDGSFSDDGLVEFIPAPAGEAAATKAEVTALGVDGAGRVVAAGIATQSGRVRGFLQTFGTDGAPGPARFFDFAGAGDTAITDLVVAGPFAWVAGDTGGAKYGVARFDTGTLVPDAGFGAGGVVALDGSGPRGELAVGGDGSVTLAVNSGFDLVLSRYTAAGAPDPALTNRRYDLYDNVTPDFPPGLETYDLQLAADGSYVVGGITGPFPASLLLARIKADGTLDASFAPGGAAQIAGAGFAKAILPKADGKITIIGGGGSNGNTPQVSQVLGTGEPRLKRLPHITPEAVPAGGTLKCDPGDVGTGATFTNWWPQVDDDPVTGGPLAPLDYKTFETDAGKSYRCVVFPRVAGRAFGPITSDNTGTVLAKGADTAKSVVRKLKKAKRGVVKLTVRLKQAGTITVTGPKGFSYKKKLGKGTKTLRLKPGKKAKKLTIALTQGTVTTTVTKKIKR